MSQLKKFKEENMENIEFADYDITGKPAPDRVTNELTELDAYYLGLTSYSKDAEKWNLGQSIYFE